MPTLARYNKKFPLHNTMLTRRKKLAQSATYNGHPRDAIRASSLLAKLVQKFHQWIHTHYLVLLPSIVRRVSLS
jgi:hypothetical protein